MKKKIISIGIIIALVLTMLTPAVSALSAERISGDILDTQWEDLFYPDTGTGSECSVENENNCLHSTLYNFDDDTMTVNGVYQNNSIETLLFDVAYYADDHHAVILKKGQVVTDGYLEQGMEVKIYHGNLLYGTYTISELLRPYPQTRSNNYGFVLPLDRSNLLSLISSDFGSNFGGPNTSRPTHQGTDFTWGGISGTPIRAVKAGTVTASVYSNSYGNYVRIDHGGGIVTLYAHMSSRAVSSGSVSQGQIIGYVGSTGDSTGPHLHFEVRLNGEYKYPVSYLQGASVWTEPPVTPTNPGKPTLNTPTSSGNGIVNFSWGATSNTTHYELRVYRDGDILHNISNITGTSYSLNMHMQEGATYSAYLTSKNNNLYADSNFINFSVNLHTFTADVNGDGRSDMIVSRNINGKRAFSVYLGKTNGTFDEPITTNSSRNFLAGDPVFTGDVNGDGRADIIVHWSSGGKRQLLVYLANANGTYNEGVNLSSYFSHDPAMYPCQFFVADVNGDGKDDFIVHWKDGNGKRCNIVYRGTATGLSDGIYALNSNNNYIASDPVFVGDVNGDGRADMIVHWESGGKRQLLVYTANANGTYNAGSNLSSYFSHDPAMYPCQFFVADVNGDGKDDFIVHWKDGNGKRCNIVYKGTATGLSDGIYALNSANGYFAWDPVFVGDVNGDGRADMIVHWENGGKRQLLVYTANADGTYNAGSNLSSYFSHSPAAYPCQFFVTDVNGDGKDDLTVKWKYGNDISFLTYLGTANGSLQDASYNILNNAIPY